MVHLSSYGSHRALRSSQPGAPGTVAAPTSPRAGPHRKSARWKAPGPRRTPNLSGHEVVGGGPVVPHVGRHDVPNFERLSHLEEPREGETSKCQCLQLAWIHPDLKAHSPKRIFLKHIVPQVVNMCVSMSVKIESTHHPIRPNPSPSVHLFQDLLGHCRAQRSEVRDGGVLRESKRKRNW